MFIKCFVLEVDQFKKLTVLEAALAIDTVVNNTG